MTDEETVSLIKDIAYEKGAADNLAVTSLPIHQRSPFFHVRNYPGNPSKANPAAFP